MEDPDLLYKIFCVFCCKSLHEGNVMYANAFNKYIVFFNVFNKYLVMFIHLFKQNLFDIQSILTPVAVIVHWQLKLLGKLVGYPGEKMWPDSRVVTPVELHAPNTLWKIGNKSLCVDNIFYLLCFTLIFDDDFERSAYTFFKKAYHCPFVAFRLKSLCSNCWSLNESARWSHLEQHESGCHIYHKALVGWSAKQKIEAFAHLFANCKVTV